MEMTDVIERIDARIAELVAQGKRVSERSISVAATGSPDTIRNWRRAALTGKVAGATTIKMQQVAEALGVTVDWLMMGEPGVDDAHAQAISEIVALLRELDHSEVEILRAAAKGVHARRHGDS